MEAKISIKATDMDESLQVIINNIFIITSYY